MPRPLVFWLPVMVALALAAVHRTPLLAEIRAPLLVLLCTVCAAVLWRARQGLPLSKRRLVQALIVALACGFALGKEITFRRERCRVLAAPPAQLQRVGRHLVVGYTDFAEVSELARLGAVGGIYVTARNLGGADGTQLARELRELQRIRRAAGLPPLIVAADQEGGAVSRLSPPLSFLPPLSALLDPEEPDQQVTARVQRYAAQQARELLTLGVNVNFGPVVDLALGHGSILDLHSQIAARAISAEPVKVATIAHAYASSLERHGVVATVKHFPGLGRVSEDTHLFTATLTESRARLATADWLPFRRVATSTSALIMLGHVKVPDVDPDQLASASERLVQGVIRRGWSHQGVIITDDMCMLPVWRENGGFGANIVRALEAGVDLLLVSYDPDQLYPALAALLDADERGELRNDRLAKSRHRLDRLLGRLGVR